MSFNHTLSAVLRGRWMIDKKWAEAHYSKVLLMLEGKPVDFAERNGEAQYEMPFAINPKDMSRHEMFAYTPYGYKKNANIPEGSVGILPISGPIMKYNGDCGEPGTVQKASWLMDMQSRDHISSVVMLMDTPGGEVSSLDPLLGVVENFKKPILSYVSGMNASLGNWFSAASDEVYLSTKMSEQGSIGSYAMLADFRGALELKGIKLHEIYAPQSTDKNKDYRDALNGDYAAVESDLKMHVDDFISYIKKERPKTAETEKEWNSGKMFYATDAIRLGHADGIRSFSQVISKAAWNAKMKKKKLI